MCMCDYWSSRFAVWACAVRPLLAVCASWWVELGCATLFSLASPQLSLCSASKLGSTSQGSRGSGRAGVACTLFDFSRSLTLEVIKKVLTIIYGCSGTCGSPSNDGAAQSGIEH